jgi:GNAT superfamily N-acetyltransferase
MAVSVRLARPSDAGEIARLMAQLGYDVEASTLTARLSRLMPRPDQRFLVAELETRAAGWLHAAIADYLETGRFVTIAGLVVDGSSRRRGIGRTLMAEAEKWAAEQGCSMVRLWSSVARAPAHRFHERLGYANIKTQYAFAKSLHPAGQVDLNRFVPRVED